MSSWFLEGSLFSEGYPERAITDVNKGLHKRQYLLTLELL